jgi:LiaI-LiaF-like transmembrane region
MFWGASLIVVGTLIFLNQVGILDLRLGEYIIPALLIILGIRMLLSGKKSK